MGFLSKLRDLFVGGGADRNALYIYVKCNACGEVIRSRVNLMNDLSVDYEGRSRSFYWRKQLVGSRRGCYRPIEVDLTFDERKSVVSEDVRGGTFVTEQDYLDQLAEEESGPEGQA
jgi:hypothetical protein